MKFFVYRMGGEHTNYAVAAETREEADQFFISHMKQENPEWYEKYFKIENYHVREVEGRVIQWADHPACF